MLAARRTLRLGGHSAAGLPIVTAATLPERGASREVPRRDQKALPERELARAEVLDEVGEGAGP